MKHKEIKAKLVELRGMSSEQASAELLKLRREQFNLRMQAAAGQGAKPDQHGTVRKSIARLKTVQSELARKPEPAKQAELAKKPESAKKPELTKKK